LILLVGLLIALSLFAPSALRRWSEQRAAARQVVFAVPPGTAARLAAGEQVSVLPATITLALDQQDTLIIRNDDTQPVQIGPFKIEPGQRFTQQYFNTGSYDLICTLHASGRLRVIVIQTMGES
jgi:hypothetical protein